MPDIEFAFLADAAEVQPGSKFNVLGGGISHVNGGSMPFVHPHLALVVGLRLTSIERNRKVDLGFVLTAPDGAQITTANGVVEAHGPQDPNDVVITISIDLWSLTFKKVGSHAVRITVDGEERKRLPLLVTHSSEAKPKQTYLA